jgi:rubrerythrin
MSILTGVVIVVGCSAAGFLVAILIVNLRAKLKKPVPVRASRRQVDLPDFQSIPQEATARLDAIYEKAFDALKEMDPKKPTKLIEKSGPAKQTQKTVNRQVLQSMVGPSYNDPNEGSEFLEIPKKFLRLASNIEKSKLLTSEQMDEKLKKRSRRVVCQKCGHKWLPLNKKLPKHCPNCHTTIWNKK